MRNKILILFVITLTTLSVNSYAQKIGNFNLHMIYSTSIDSMRIKADSLASFLGKGYHLMGEKKEESMFGGDEYSREYKSSEGRKLKILISSDVVGDNPALEKPGIKCYYIIQILGKYKDVFKIYKQIDTKADLVRISKHEGTSFVGLSSLFDRFSRDMITFDPSVRIIGGHKDVWAIRFLVNDFIEHKADI